MSDNTFTINRRFVIDKTRNEVFDKESGQKIRVEPRLIKLLCMLADSGRTVLTRPRIINEIWDDYPGANEGLNQSISFLRKILCDSQKELVLTIPKKGYVFNGIISVDSDPEFIEGKKIRKSWFMPARILLTVLLVSGWYIFFISRRSNTFSNADHDQRNLPELARLDAMSQATKTRHLESKQNSVLSFDSSREKNLIELSRLDMVCQANKKPHSN